MKFFRFFIVYILVQSIFFTSVAQANSALGGWTINSKVAQGASMLINASKTVLINGSNIAKTSTALLKPAVPQVTKFILRGGGGYALSIAVEQLIGAVDWVLDPANSAIKYRDKADPQKPDPTSLYIFVRLGGFATICRRTYPVQNEASLKKDSETCFNSTWPQTPGTATTVDVSGANYTVNITSSRGAYSGIYQRQANPVYDPNAKPQDEEKSIPLDTVSQKIIDNAESSTNNDVKVGSQTVTIGAAEDALANDSATQSNVRNQLETNSKTQTNEDAKGDTKPKDPANPTSGSDLSLKFPVFCSWAPVVCEAAQTVISFPQTVTNWWDTSTKSITDSWIWTKEQYNAVTKSVTDFFKEEPNNDTELDIPEPEMPEIDTELKFGGQCPDDRVAQIPFVLRTIEMKFSYQPVCQVVSDAKPVLIFVGFFIAALIVGGIKQ